MKFLALTFLLIFSNAALAQDDNFTHDSIQNQGLDVSGDFERPKRMTQAEKMRLARKRLEKQTMIMMQKKMEQRRMRAELKMYKQLEEQMNSQLKQIEKL